mmetsp:Transcript_2644/g.2282  ORF Transcript_2644/g.2282 Transcript_2644/m.2282 type:complete len:111 (+) Transcript_2644:1132-1464(+)|eukprot:CAMPEP_0114575766 /NCGR_PEP_ID=MMETSP0125-20121206/596_1 /TAXON_ID=485358 ORGANISM="Aristerostoma sp., Strain ATCC 50986" /NCGR_SAMPLE_ID=MMETSP0125 /ASSEMBLY_ACC=CAM_ASM_000245 /LENGTH=110 /DNA_ID=CAMNT_0001763745 /DNA_START=3189 /DNA_END=3524 /DNA_ORIENTATION=-
MACVAILLISDLSYVFYQKRYKTDLIDYFEYAIKEKRYDDPETFKFLKKDEDSDDENDIVHEIRSNTERNDTMKDEKGGSRRGSQRGALFAFSASKKDEPSYPDPVDHPI